MHVVILGVGGVGAMAAWRLSRAGHAVTALEQFGIDHDRGSSYGASRIVRRVYPDAHYTHLMAEAYALWSALMTEAGDDGLFVPCGGVYVGPADAPLMVAAQQALQASGVRYEVLSPAESARRFPRFPLRAQEVALYEPGMGFARASACVRAAVGLARRYGAQVREGTAVVGIDAGRDGYAVRVTLATGEVLSADRLLICAGAWTGALLSALGVTLPLTVTRQPYVHLRVVGDESEFLPGRFPVWIDAVANAYGFPVTEAGAGLKIGLHDRGAVVAPDTVEREVTESDRESVRRYAAGRFGPEVSGVVVYEKVCLYTSTPDEDFVVDAVPGLPGAFVISACSGHGFKFAPLMGQIAVDLVEDRNVRDLTRFRTGRWDALPVS
ncbi:MAG: N-methyl-L-tryptophan oxidase [Chloroherpetonaceae bacterium]|nr:N-methyl-L-tryptophan oxidase [Chthonomonadaceae bacterium]MDW8208079.1 N-methyl-L-tryptophan oxidase [Chloroherpetonaceae bacterium]